MADIVQSLFGVTPELYQQAQAQRAADRALQYAQLDPFQRATYGIGIGVNQLGRALGGTDPELQMISARNAIARQIDYTNPESRQRGILALTQAGDITGAMQLTNIDRDLTYKQAQTVQSQAAALASATQAKKTQAEIDEIARQQAAFERLYPTASAATPAAAAAAAPAPAPAAAPEAAATPGMVYENVSQGTLAGEPIVKRVGVAAVSPRPDLVVTPLPPVGNLPAPAPVIPGEAAAPMPAPAAAPAPAPAPAPAVPARSRATLTQQISDLESQRAKLLALTKVPAAKARADVLGEQIKDLRSQLKPTEIANLEREIDQFRADGVADTDPRVKNRLDKIAKLVSSGAEQFGADRESVALELYDKSFAKLTQTQRAVVNKRVQEEGTGRAKASAAQFVLPGDKQLGDIPKFRRDVQATIEPQLKAINSADQALQAINDSLATGNFVSFNAARVQLAKALGDSQLSRRDVEQAGGDPSILGGLIDLTSKAFTSTPGVDTQKKIRDTLTAIRTVATNKAKAEVDVQRKIALRSPGYNPEAVNTALDFPELRAAPAPTTTGGGSLAEQAAAELARRKGAK